jgi:uridine phosphorylase
MMQRDVHLHAKGLLESLQFRQGDFGEIGIISGQHQRAQRCLQYLENPVKNFTFLGYTFWTGLYKGKKVTVGNGGFYAPDSAFVTEILCVGGIKTLIRLGSCGAMLQEMNVGDFVVVDKVIRGDGATRYYVDDNFISQVDKDLSKKLVTIFEKQGKVYQGGCWTTDAMFRETKEIVNPYIEKGAICVDMVTSPFVTIANVYKTRVAAILVVSDNLLTGQMGFADFRLFDAEEKMTKTVFEIIA